MMKSKTKSYTGHRIAMMLLLAAVAVVSMALTAGPAFGLDVTAGVTDAGPVIEDEPITLKVRNNNWFDMRVYAVVGGRRWRLGTAYTGRQSVLQVPAHLRADIVPLELVAYPIGGSGAAETGELLPSPGDQIDWVLENNLSMSSVFMLRPANGPG